MADDEDAQQPTEPEQNEPIFSFGMIRIVDQPRVLIREHGRRLLEGHPVLLQIRRRLARVPGDLQICHIYIVPTL